MADKPSPEIAERLDFLRSIGQGVDGSIRAVLAVSYDCNCVHCRGGVLMYAILSTLGGADVDEAEIAIRGLVLKLLETRRELRKAAEFAEACEAVDAAHLDTGLAN